MSQDTLPCLSSKAKSIVVGDLYEHYKGLRYKILGVARHSETLEELIVYQALYPFHLNGTHEKRIKNSQISNKGARSILN